MRPSVAVEATYLAVIITVPTTPAWSEGHSPEGVRMAGSTPTRSISRTRTPSRTKHGA